MPLDSAFGRLWSAWRPPLLSVVALEGAAVHAAMSALLSRPRADGSRSVGLLIAASGEPAAQALARQPLFAARGASAPIRVDASTPADAAALGWMLAERAPRVLLIDVDLCALWGLPALRQLRRAHPQTDWLLGWHEPSPRWTEAIVHSRARGCFEWGAGARELARALDAVLAGDLWFPRTVTQWLYASLLGDAHDVGESQPLSQWELTPREAEVLSLASQGLTNKHIAQRLDISVNTVKKHMASTFDKRGLRSRRQTMG